MVLSSLAPFEVKGIRVFFVVFRYSSKLLKHTILPWKKEPMEALMSFGENISIFELISTISLKSKDTAERIIVPSLPSSLKLYRTRCLSVFRADEYFFKIPMP